MACWAAPASALIGLSNDVWILAHVDDGDVRCVVGPRSEELETEERPLGVAMLNGVQDVGMGVRCECGLGASQREGRSETASSISRRTSDQGRAAAGLER